MKFNITTFGCKANQYDSYAITEYMRENADNAGFGESVHVINSCTVTETADRKIAALIAKLKREKPCCTVVLCGCLPKAYPEKAAAMGADVVIAGKFPISPATALVNPLPYSPQRDRKRAFLKIQDGCNRDCAYCIIPKARGNPVSRPIADIAAEAQSLAANHSEIMITGINLALYAYEEHGLVGAVEAICKALESKTVPVRIGSLEPDLLSDTDITRLAQIPKTQLRRHFHLSLQSGCDAVLHRMNRRYDTAQYRSKIASLRGAFGANVAITTDIIVGFPGETQAEFAQTLAFVQEMGFAKIHVFRFSAREGTAAASMAKQIAPSEKKARFTALSEFAGTGKRVEDLG
ncbi:MAG: radical SAM protein [Oscillospiraceae bacterium]|nr:radical SAM protein [Oscillospiraceae bacterium]